MLLSLYKSSPNKREAHQDRTFSLLFLFPWEFDWWKLRLVFQIRKLSNRPWRLPVCKQHIKANSSLALDHPHQISVLYLCLSPSLSRLTFLTPFLQQHLSFSLSFSGFHLSSICSSVVAIIGAAAGKLQAAHEPLFLLAVIILQRLSTKPITLNLPAKIHCILTVSPSQPLTCLILRDENECCGGGDHGLPA